LYNYANLQKLLMDSLIKFIGTYWKFLHAQNAIRVNSISAKKTNDWNYILFFYILKENIKINMFDV